MVTKRTGRPRGRPPSEDSQSKDRFLHAVVQWLVLDWKMPLRGQSGALRAAKYLVGGFDGRPPRGWIAHKSDVGETWSQLGKRIVIDWPRFCDREAEHSGHRGAIFASEGSIRAAYQRVQAERWWEAEGKMPCEACGYWYAVRPMREPPAPLTCPSCGCAL